MMNLNSIVKPNPTRSHKVRMPHHTNIGITDKLRTHCDLHDPPLAAFA